MSTYRYRICGLTIGSAIALPGAVPAPDDGPADIVVGCGAVPDTLDGATASGPNWQWSDRRTIFMAGDAARILVEGGCRITVDLIGTADARDIAGYLIGSGFGILMHQRGALALHGAAVARGGRALAICGDSGAGKSTLAAALVESGCRFLADDLCAIDPGTPPTILSDGRQLKLWQSAIDALALARQERVSADEEKYFVSSGPMAGGAPPLKAIYLLARHGGDAPAEITPLPLPAAARALERNTYLPHLIALHRAKGAAFARNAALLQHVSVFRLARTMDLTRLAETVAAVQAHFDTLA